MIEFHYKVVNQIVGANRSNYLPRKLTICNSKTFIAIRNKDSRLLLDFRDSSYTVSKEVLPGILVLALDDILG